MIAQTDNRKQDLAKIHIAKKDLGLDDDTYRTIVRSVGGVDSGSSADLDASGRARLLAHFRSKGWRIRRRRVQNCTEPMQKRVTSSGDLLANDNQTRMIRSLWIQMADAGAVKNRTEAGLRAWVRSATRRYHPNHAGYSALRFLPDWVAQRLIEHLKRWGARCNVRFDE